MDSAAQGVPRGLWLLALEATNGVPFSVGAGAVISIAFLFLTKNSGCHNGSAARPAWV